MITIRINCVISFFSHRPSILFLLAPTSTLASAPHLAPIVAPTLAPTTTPLLTTPRLSYQYIEWMEVQKVTLLYPNQSY